MSDEFQSGTEFRLGQIEKKMDTWQEAQQKDRERQWQTITEMKEALVRLASLQETAVKISDRQTEMDKRVDDLVEKMQKIDMAVNSLNWIRKVIPSFTIFLILGFAAALYYGFELQLLHEKDLEVIAQLNNEVKTPHPPILIPKVKIFPVVPEVH